MIAKKEVFIVPGLVFWTFFFKTWRSVDWYPVLVVQRGKVALCGRAPAQSPERAPAQRASQEVFTNIFNNNININIFNNNININIFNKLLNNYFNNSCPESRAGSCSTSVKNKDIFNNIVNKLLLISHQEQGHIRQQLRQQPQQQLQQKNAPSPKRAPARVASRTTASSSTFSAISTWSSLISSTRSSTSSSTTDAQTQSPKQAPAQQERNNISNNIFTYNLNKRRPGSQTLQRLQQLLHEHRQQHPQQQMGVQAMMKSFNIGCFWPHSRRNTKFIWFNPADRLRKWPNSGN